MLVAGADVEGVLCASTMLSADQYSTQPPALFTRTSTRSPVNAIGVIGDGFGSFSASIVTRAVTVARLPNEVWM